MANPQRRRALSGAAEETPTVVPDAVRIAAASARGNPLVVDALFAGMAAIAADAIIAIDDEQRVIFFNAGAEQTFGWSASEMLGEPLTKLLPERHRAAHQGHVTRFGASHERARRMGERQEIAGLRKSGEEFPAEASIARLTIGGQPVFTVVLRDITQRKRAEDRQRFLAEAGEALAASLDVERTIEHVAGLAVPRLGSVCLVDVFADAGAAGTALARGGSAHAVADVDDDPEAAALWRALAALRQRSAAPPRPADGSPAARVLETREPFVATEAPAEVLLRLLAAPGATAASADPAAATAVVRRLLAEGLLLMVPLVARGRSIGLLTLYRRRAATGGTGLATRGLWYEADGVALAVDLARRAALAVDSARLYDAVQRALRSRDEVMGIVSHDLRNPVQAVKMLSGAILAGGGTVPGDVAEQVGVIRHAAEQMDALIQDLLDATRIEAGQLHVSRQPLDVTALVQSALQTLAPLATAKEQTLTLDAASDLPMVLADADRVEQLLSNVVGNAMKFTPRGGRVTVSVAPVDGASPDSGAPAAAAAAEAVRVTVQDDGPGVSADQLEHVFDRYWQGRPAGRHGAGLGLPIAKGIVEAHGGRIWMESAAGAGARVTFTLPATTASDAAADADHSLDERR
ncbi:MAG TPA: PAS domain-containing sensor histidine kinase [Gemmatimonadaceae bacterium]|nr:PAS domain-containing sensor histidine kinase [Gemmatimonadaceae bacterium]